MKTIIIFAAAAAALGATSMASAEDRSNGHWEWEAREVFGPNKANLPTRIRVWVKDDMSKMANCDCAMMHDAKSAADCMASPRKGAGPSNG